MFAEHNVTIQTADDRDTELVFPVSLIERAETFDALMGDIAEAIERGTDPLVALDDHAITGPAERQSLEKTIASMQQLHAEGPQSHLGILHSQLGPTRRPVPQQGGRDRRQPAVAELQSDCEHPARGAGAAEQRPLRHLGRRPLRHPAGSRWPILRPQR